MSRHLMSRIRSATTELALRHLAAAILGLLVAPASKAQVNTTQAAPAQQVSRVVDLSGDWRFLPSNTATSYADTSVNDAMWPVMRLPSNWFLQGSTSYPVNADKPPNTGSPGDLWPVDPEGGLDWRGTIWFRRNFDWQPNARTHAQSRREGGAGATGRGRNGPQREERHFARGAAGRYLSEKFSELQPHANALATRGPTGRVPLPHGCATRQAGPLVVLGLWTAE